jgi:hypothetical protein
VTMTSACVLAGCGPNPVTCALILVAIVVSHDVVEGRGFLLADLGFERQPVPSSCHVNQDGLHSRIWRILRHLSTFSSAFLTLDRIHNATPPNCYSPPKQLPCRFDEPSNQNSIFQSAVSFWAHTALGRGREAA